MNINGWTQVWDFFALDSLITTSQPTSSETHLINSWVGLEFNQAVKLNIGCPLLNLNLFPALTKSVAQKYSSVFLCSPMFYEMSKNDGKSKYVRENKGK